MLTGLKDLDREVLKHVHDKELLKVCRVIKKTWNEVCDDNFLRRRLAKYPGIEKYKKDNESWKQFFLIFLYYTSKMREKYEFEYENGDFKTQYTILEGEIDLLYQAAQKGELSLVKYAINNGAKTGKNLALHAATKNGHIDIVKYLIELGADVQSGGDYSLTSASFNGFFDIVKYLVEKGANIHARNDSALTYAVQKQHFDIVKYLIEHGANVRADRNLPLLRAAENGNIDIVKYLVERGADIHDRDNRSLYLANFYGHDKVVNYLKTSN